MKILILTFSLIFFNFYVKSEYSKYEQRICIGNYLRTKGLIEVHQQQSTIQIQECDKILFSIENQMINDILSSYNISNFNKCKEKLIKKSDDLLLIKLMTLKFQKDTKELMRKRFEIGALIFQCMDENKSAKIEEIKKNPQKFIEKELNFFPTTVEEKFCLKKYLTLNKLVKIERLNFKDKNETSIVCPVDCKKQMHKVKGKFRLENAKIALNLNEKKCWNEVHGDFFDSIISFFFVKEYFKDSKSDEKIQISIDFFKLRNLWIKCLYECLTKN